MPGARLRAGGVGAAGRLPGPDRIPVEAALGQASLFQARQGRLHLLGLPPTAAAAWGDKGKPALGPTQHCARHACCAAPTCPSWLGPGQTPAAAPRRQTHPARDAHQRCRASTVARGPGQGEGTLGINALLGAHACTLAASWELAASLPGLAGNTPLPPSLPLACPRAHVVVELRVGHLLLLAHDAQLLKGHRPRGCRCSPQAVR